MRRRQRSKTMVDLERLLSFFLLVLVVSLIFTRKTKKNHASN
jgi:hypothetical protein